MLFTESSIDLEQGFVQNEFKVVQWSSPTLCLGNISTFPLVQSRLPGGPLQAWHPLLSPTILCTSPGPFVQPLLASPHSARLLQSTASSFRGWKQAQAGPGQICGIKAHLSSFKFTVNQPRHLTVTSSSLQSRWPLLFMLHLDCSTGVNHPGYHLWEVGHTRVRVLPLGGV